MTYQPSLVEEASLELVDKGIELPQRHATILLEHTERKYVLGASLSFYNSFDSVDGVFTIYRQQVTADHEVDGLGERAIAIEGKPGDLYLRQVLVARCHVFIQIIVVDEQPELLPSMEELQEYALALDSAVAEHACD